MVLWKPRDKFKEKPQQQYIVEFPEDLAEEGKEKEEQLETPKVVGLAPAELVEGIKTRLLLKRHKEEDEDESGSPMEARVKKKLTGSNVYTTGDSSSMDQHNDGSRIMEIESSLVEAGEAGFVLPQKDP